MFHSSYIELSKSALQNNIDFIKQEIGPNVQFSSVIKGNAYGHGIEQYAILAQQCGVDHFSVFSADEAQRLLAVISKPATVLIMGYLDNEELKWAIQNDLEFFVFEQDRLTEAAKTARMLGKKATIHLEVETGMNRTGFAPHLLCSILDQLHNYKDAIYLKGVCTHFAGAESMQNHERIMEQLRLFNEQVSLVKAKGFDPEQIHTASSAATFFYPHTRLNLVRVGIMQYGFWPSPETYDFYSKQHPDKKDPLRRLINWKTHVMTLKQVKQGDYIGYGSSFKAPRDMVLAIVPVGYAWGYSRSLSNQGQVLICGQQVPVVGIVSMNVLTVDVTDVPDVQKGDEVVLLGKQKDKSISVASFAELSTQLNYELLTRLPMNIPRLIVD
ncbi:alanine racemase [Pontibacter cellulosilyticus]|uniref:Alanine racemase n=1 Tax=Pontibacter cellulosilyticus TaxID=1720253 RepID=A0A923SIE6_9BACT|nr:alanine racemase [Pontibacter cellulosilyticus]MBC5991586.1 alanine racemase [Pontibacter cellulosilyticus]